LLRKILPGAHARALIGAAVVGSTLGLGLSVVYLAEANVPAVAAQARAERLASAAAVGFYQAAPQQNPGQTGPGAAAVAARRDGPIVAGLTARDGPSAAFAAKLQRADPAPSGPTMAGLIRPPAPRPGRLDAHDRFGLTAARAPDRAPDLQCLAQAVYYEARGESAAGQQAVAQVVLNRVRSPAFPKTVCAVVFQGASVGHGCQFSFACDGSMDDRREPAAWRRAEAVATHALGGFVMAEVGKATHFHASRLGPDWSLGMVRVAQVGLHVFYRFGHGGAAIHAPADSVQTADAGPTTSPTTAPVQTPPVYASLAPPPVDVRAQAQPVSAVAAGASGTAPSAPIPSTPASSPRAKSDAPTA
jgi:spore germination cell wall hydrolase CwlJ-like protein